MAKILKIALFAAASMGIIFLTGQKADGLLHVNILDVGQGDAILIQTPKGKTILIDGGPDNTVIRELGEVLPFYKRTIDLIILTHPDRDHLVGLLEVVKRYKVKGALVTGVSKRDPMYESFLSFLNSKNVHVKFANAENDIEFEEDIFLDILFPDNTLLASPPIDINETSIIFRLDYLETNALFTGDAEESTEEYMVKKYEKLDELSVLRADLLKTGHHGSKTSSTKEFLEAVMPKLAAISVGRDNKFGHPVPEVLKRLERAGAKISRTDIQGRLEFVSDGNEWEIN